MTDPSLLAVLHCSDDKILDLGTRESGYVDYRLGRKVSVSYRGNDRYLCLTCVKAECCHVERIRRYRSEHLEVLTVPMADPALNLEVVE